MEEESESSDGLDTDWPELIWKEKKGNETESNDELDFCNDEKFENIGLPQRLVEIDLEKFWKRAKLGNTEIWEALNKWEEIKPEEDKLSDKKDKKKKKVIATWTPEEDE